MRASNTSPKLVLRFEGDTEDNLNQIKTLFEKNFLRIFPDIKLDYHYSSISFKSEFLLSEFN